MRNKKAKLLRRFAESKLPGNSVIYTHGKPPAFAYDDNGNLLKVAPGVPTTLDKSCSRALYKSLKGM